MKQGPLFRFFHRLLAPPIFEDAEETHRAHIQNAFLLATLLITFVFALIVVPSSPIPGKILAIFILVDAFAMLALAFLRRGWLNLSAALFLLAIWGVITFTAVAIHGDVSSPVLEGYLVVILAAGLFLDGRYALGFAGLSTLALTGMYLASSRGWTPEALFVMTLARLYILNILVLFVGVALAYVASQSVKAALGRARRHEGQLSEKNHQLQEILASLEQRIAERTAEIFRQKQFYQALVENSPIAIVTLDLEHRIISFNPAFEKLFGYTLEEALGQDLDDLITSSTSWTEANAYTQLVLAGQTIMKTGLRRCKDGRLLDVEMYGVPVLVNGRQIGGLAMYHDISERIKAEEHLKHLATHDPLTFLPNRVLFYEHLHHALLSARRNGHRVAVLFLDLDGFKFVNDLLGHSKGDVLLQQVAERFKQALRMSDLAARLGGDEFAFVFQDIRDPEDAAAIAEKILASLSSPFILEGQELSVSGSIGISLYPEDGSEARDLLRFADAAMYRVKGQGKHHFQFFSWKGEPNGDSPARPVSGENPAQAAVPDNDSPQDSAGSTFSLEAGHGESPSAAPGEIRLELPQEGSGPWIG